MNNLYKDLSFTNAEIQQEKYKQYFGSGVDHWDFIGSLEFQLLKEFGIQPNHTLLEFGCGPARASLYFIDYLKPNQFHGADINDSFIDIAKTRIKETSLQDKQPNFYQTDKFLMPPNMDYIFSWSVLNHINSADYQKFINLCNQSLNTGGKLITTHSDWFLQVIIPDSMRITKLLNNNDEVFDTIRDSIHIDDIYKNKLKNNSNVQSCPIVEITKFK